MRGEQKAPEEQAERVYQVPESILLALINEVGLRPYKEVFKIIAAASSLVRDQQAEPEQNRIIV